MTSKKLNCWEDTKCGREPGGTRSEQFGPCPAATDVTCDGINGGNNAGRLCWAIPATLCEGNVQGTCSDKAGNYQQCSFFRRVKYEEGTHFHLLKPGLGTLDPIVLHKRLNDVVILMTVCRDVFACLAVGPLLKRITEHALAMTHSSSAGVYFLSKDSEELVLKAGVGAIDLPGRISLSDESPIASAMRDRRTVKGVFELPDRVQPAPMIAVPVGGESGLAGVLSLLGNTEDFSTDDEWFMEELAMITGVGISNAQMIESLRDLREVDKAKSRFVRLLMHQIGSPLATIACSLKACLQLGDTLSGEDRRKLIEASLHCADSITSLSKKLLDLGAIRSGSYLSEARPMCVSEILRAETDARRVQAEEKGLQIDLRVEKAGGLVLANSDALRVIFGNLLDNAIKYSPGKGSQIEVLLGETGDHLRISVRDNGIGIPPEEQERLFEEFHRAGNAVASGARGFGLGLAFVKELVDRFDGRIEVDSEVGKGTSVTIEFPLLNQVEAERATTQQTPGT